MYTPITAERIDEYAMSMFATETLHERWLCDCTGYLKQLFGDRLVGARVIDCGFGRGNWSVAFLRAGASEVIAVDASAFNVARISAYAKQHSLKGLRVVEWNLLEQEEVWEADFIWLYGVLHHVREDVQLLQRLRHCLSGANSQMLVYAYNSPSLRQAMIEPARRAFVWEHYEAFRDDALLFTPSARMRARDDLTAPYIRWYERKALAETLQKAGLWIYDSAPSFAMYLGQVKPGSLYEFEPWHLHCGLNTELTFPSLTEKIHPHAQDIAMMQEWGEALVPHAKQHAKAYAIGVANTHFSAMQSGGFEAAMLENKRYLLHVTELFSPPDSSARLLAYIQQARDNVEVATRRKS